MITKKDVMKLIDGLNDKFKNMRENGDSDIRTVIYHTDCLKIVLDELFPNDDNLIEEIEAKWDK